MTPIFWGKANNFQELVAFLLSYVATIILANTKFSLDIILYICYDSSHYVCRDLSPHPWWHNVYAASAARVLSRPRQGPSPHACACEPLFRGGARRAAGGPATQGGPGAPGDPPGREYVAARMVLWCGMDGLPRGSTLGHRQGGGHDPRRPAGFVARAGSGPRSRLAARGRASGDGACCLGRAELRHVCCGDALRAPGVAGGGRRPRGGRGRGGGRAA